MYNPILLQSVLFFWNIYHNVAMDYLFILSLHL